MTKPKKTPAEKLAAYAAMIAGASKGGSVTGPCKARDSQQMRAAAHKRWAAVLAKRTAAAVKAARSKALKLANKNWDRADKLAKKTDIISHAADVGKRLRAIEERWQAERAARIEARKAAAK